MDLLLPSSKLHSADNIPSEIVERIQETREILPEAERHIARIESALRTTQKSERFRPRDLSRDSLHALAESTNAAFFHYSGNCTLLSRCVHYNLMSHRNVLAATNSAPFYQSLHSGFVDKFLFGKQLTELAKDLPSLDAVEEEILDKYKKTGERFYVVGSHNYKVLGMAVGGHSFNAVVCLNKKKKPVVQFVDAWKTSDHTPTKEALSDRYHEGVFDISFSPGDSLKKRKVKRIRR